MAILSPLNGVFSTSFQRVTVSQPESSDTQFINSFSAVLGILIAFAIVLFAFARSIGSEIQERNVHEDPLAQANVQKNTEPFAHVAIAGQDNSALAALTKPAAAGPAASVPATPEAAFQAVCSACHSTGVNGAPKIGDHAAWGPRIAQGKETLYKDAIGGKGNMPPKGGTTWPDDTIKKVVDYMVSLNK
jgi:cytochrome c5